MRNVHIFLLRKCRYKGKAFYLLKSLKINSRGQRCGKSKRRSCPRSLDIVEIKTIPVLCLWFMTYRTIDKSVPDPLLFPPTLTFMLSTSISCILFVGGFSCLRYCIRCDKNSQIINYCVIDIYNSRIFINKRLIYFLSSYFCFYTVIKNLLYLYWFWKSPFLNTT